MVRGFSDDDENKPVVTAEGKRVGTVSHVKDDRARVEGERLTDEIKSALGWGDEEDDYILSPADVRTIDDNEVRLQDEPNPHDI